MQGWKMMANLKALAKSKLFACVKGERKWY